MAATVVVGGWRRLLVFPEPLGDGQWWWWWKELGSMVIEVVVSGAVRGWTVVVEHVQIKRDQNTLSKM